MNFARKITTVVLITSSLLLSGCGSPKIGVVDIEKVVEQSQRVKTLTEEAEGKMKEAQQKLEADLNANPNITDEEKNKRQVEFQIKLQGINQSYASQIKNRLDVVTEEISQQKDLDVVVNSSEDQKIVFQGAIDITDDVINKMQ